MTSLEVFARHVQPELPGCPVVIISDTIIKVVQKLCEVSDLIKGVITFPTVGGTRAYSLTMPDGMVLSRVTSVRTPSMPNGLNKTSEAEADAVTVTGVPYAFYVDGLQRLCLVSTPADVFSVDASVVMKPSHDAETIETAIYYHHLGLVSDGVRSILMRQPGKEWSNSDLAAFYSGRYEEGLTLARIASIGGNVGGSLVAKPRRLGW